MLVIYAFKNERQSEIGGLVSCITRNMGTLQKTGHQKWREVDAPNIDRIKRQVHPATAGYQNMS
jgi:hypothetical protein